MASSTPESTLHPERALPTLPWIAALGLLVVNDHVLKGSGLLPGVITGKLSDFAGLLVAPVLLATLVRARTRTSLLACHVAVGLVFAGIQLSLPFADLWSAAMGLLGHPWRITSDPSDLLALPMLLVSWRVLVPKMREEVAMLPELRRLAVAGLSLVGLWSSVATSDDGGEWDDWGANGYEDVTGDLVVNNANEQDISIYVRPLRDDVELDCRAVDEDPARMLPEQAFGEAVHWTLPARTNVAIVGTELECGAAWVAGEGVPPQLLFWRRSEYDEQVFPGQYLDLAELPAAATALVFDGVNPATWVGGEDFRFTPSTLVPELPAACESSDAARLEWDDDLPVERPLELLAIDYGPDGCFELELLDLFDQPEVSISYLCIPEAALPFAVGERIRIDAPLSFGSNQLAIRLLDESTLDVAHDEQGRPVRESTLIRREFDLSAVEVALGHDLQATPRVSCPWLLADDQCADVEQPFDLRVAETGELVAAGDAPLSFEEPDYQRTFALVHGQKRAVLDHACGGSLGLDLDVVITAGVAAP
ncbi:hypothetical protein ACNOYE_17425 [Nannocystaceae bacterium ST9]